MTSAGNGIRKHSAQAPSRSEREDAQLAEREDAQLAQVVARRAIRRLDMLEWVIFAVGAGLAAAGGAVIAWMLSGLAGWDFRSTWIGASLLLFVVPGVLSIMQIRRDERTDTRGTQDKQESEDG